MHTILTSLTCLSIAAAAEPTTLPADWHGTWSGTLELSAGKSVPMKLAIAPVAETKRVTWQITYGEGDKASVRNYELVPDSKVTGKFALDEKNGITLDMRMLNGVLHSQFEVQGSLLAGRYELRDGKLHYEITSSSKAVETGPETAKVKVYPVTAVQSAVLSKSK